MPRAMWNGAISFGLVNVPVRMYTAARSQDIRFNQLHAADNARLRMKRFCSAEDCEVTPDEIVRGYEVAPGQYVTIENTELEALAPAVTNGVEIEEFVDLSQIDPVFFESSCYLTPAMCWTVPAVSATSSRRCSTVSRSFLCPEWRSATAARPG